MEKETARIIYCLSLLCFTIGIWYLFGIGFALAMLGVIGIFTVVVIQNADK